MTSEMAGKVNELYSKRHGANRTRLFEGKPYSNFGYWAREEMAIDEACDALIDKTVRTLGIGPGDRVLEVGCGYGAGAVFYTKRYEPESVVGIDVTRVRIEEARKYILEQGLSNKIEVGLGDATSLEFPEGTFTRVLAIECAFHFQTRRDFLREAARVLMPGGGVAVADIIIRRGADREQFLAQVHPVGSDGSLDVPENIYDADVYNGVLRECGFENAQIETITDRTLPYFIRHLERVANECQDEYRDRCIHVAQIYREYLRLGLEYVLVSARKPAVS